MTRVLPAAALLLLSGCSSLCQDVLQGEWRADGRCDGWLLSITVPPYPEMPEAAKLYLQEVATVDPDGNGPAGRAPVPGSEPLWNWLSDVAVLRQQLQACR